MVKEIKSVDDFKEAIGDENTGLVIIDFFAAWCGPCKIIGPIFAEMSNEFKNVGFYKLDADNADVTDVTQACEIRVLPTFCFFSKGKFITKLVGADKSKLRSLLLENLPVEPTADQK